MLARSLRGARRSSSPTALVARAALLLALLAPLAAPAAAAPLAWRMDEFLIASAMGNQFAPAVGGSLIVWSEQREAGSR
jgi:hypothetical protein